jgi:CRP/FNR family transcriptional regulator, cyclic AMP receptor protein
MSTEVQLLSEVPFFQLMDDDERSALAEHLEIVQMPEGQVIFNTGDPGGSLFIVRSGEVEIFFKNDTGERIVLETALPGDFFGELSLLDKGARSASAVVVKNLEALRLDRDDLEQFLKRHPEAAMDLLTVTGRRLRSNVEKLRHTATRNVNAETEDKRTRVQKVADWIAEFSGGMPFLMLNAGFFFVWIILNINVIPYLEAFDPFPFGLLTMAVSLEAIFLSIFVLISQNRQAAKDRVRSDIEYDVNLKAEMEIAHLHEKVDHMHSEMLMRLDQMEKHKL